MTVLHFRGFGNEIHQPHHQEDAEDQEDSGS